MDNKPIPSENNLRDVIDWLKSGDTIILYTQKKRKIYRIPTLPPNRKISIDVGNQPYLLNEGEWYWYINDVGAVLIDEDTVEAPNGKYQFFLPFL